MYNTLLSHKWFSHMPILKYQRNLGLEVVFQKIILPVEIYATDGKWKPLE
jgi:hypothetical protein